MIFNWESANGGFKLLIGVLKGLIGRGLKEASQGELTSTVISRGNDAIYFVLDALLSKRHMKINATKVPVIYLL